MHNDLEMLGLVLALAFLIYAISSRKRNGEGDNDFPSGLGGMSA